MEGHSDGLSSLCLCEDGSRLYSGSYDMTIKVWDTATNTCIATVQGYNSYVTSLCLSFKTNRLIVVLDQKTIKVLDTTTNKYIGTGSDKHRDSVFTLALSDNSDILYSALKERIQDRGIDVFAIKAWQLKYILA
jgi:WD40 repeat protein